MSAPRLVGLSGYAGVGKDSVADVLKREHDYVCVRVAEPIRASLLALNPYVPVDGAETRLSDVVQAFGWEEAKKAVPEVRRLMQRFGTEVCRDILAGSPVVAAWRDEVQLNLRHHPVVVPDVRFEDEVSVIHALGGKVWRIRRPGVKRSHAHISEELPSYDRLYDNSGSLANLSLGVAMLLR